jgi:hypothetical protein
MLKTAATKLGLQRRGSSREAISAQYQLGRACQGLVEPGRFVQQQGSHHDLHVQYKGQRPVAAHPDLQLSAAPLPSWLVSDVQHRAWLHWHLRLLD